MVHFELVPMILEYLTEGVPINRFYPLPLFSLHLPFYHDPIDFIEQKCKFLYYQVSPATSGISSSGWASTEKLVADHRHHRLAALIQSCVKDAHNAPVRL